MRVVNEKELFAYYVYSFLQKYPIVELSPDRLVELFASFHCLTLKGKWELTEEMVNSDWYL